MLGAVASEARVRDGHACRRLQQQEAATVPAERNGLETASGIECKGSERVEPVLQQGEVHMPLHDRHVSGNQYSQQFRLLAVPEVDQLSLIEREFSASAPASPAPLAAARAIGAVKPNCTRAACTSAADLVSCRTPAQA